MESYSNTKAISSSATTGSISPNVNHEEADHCHQKQTLALTKGEEEDVNVSDGDQEPVLVLGFSEASSSSSPSSSMELDLIGSFGREDNNLVLKLDNSGSEEISVGEPTKIFSCNYCRRKFYSSQALGGHQNSHKRERSLAKRAAAQVQAQQYAMEQFPFRSGPLGIRAHAMVHKPTAAGASYVAGPEVSYGGCPYRSPAMAGDWRGTGHVARFGEISVPINGGFRWNIADDRRPEEVKKNKLDLTLKL